ncbi:hypothetical protein E3N88_04427 [Mikania micrantha]|uniref:Uncharacterized protein n=1 Tax=Mikania micrantha TaxID=192012 RepID=A0A5N6PUD0_9ASTR|nr:hypothetical protein E3N88_04427 [Mikania micrantha]
MVVPKPTDKISDLEEESKVDESDYHKEAEVLGTMIMYISKFVSVNPRRKKTMNKRCYMAANKLFTVLREGGDITRLTNAEIMTLLTPNIFDLANIPLEKPFNNSMGRVTQHLIKK